MIFPQKYANMKKVGRKNPEDLGKNGAKQAMREKRRIKGRLRILSLCLSVFILFGILPTGLFASAATTTEYQPTYKIEEFRTYDISGEEISKLYYKDMKVVAATEANGVKQENVTLSGDEKSGVRYTVTTEQNKNSKFRFLLFSATMWVPSRTWYSTRFDVYAGGARTVSDKRATAAASIVLFRFGERPSLDALNPTLEETWYMPVTKDESTSFQTNGDSAGLIRTQLRGKGSQLTTSLPYVSNSGEALWSGETSGTWVTGDTARLDYYHSSLVFKNNTDEGQYIKRYFALVVDVQYGSKYANSISAYCELKTYAVHSSAKVQLYKDGKPWEGQTITTDPRACDEEAYNTLTERDEDSYDWENPWGYLSYYSEVLNKYGLKGYNVDGTQYGIYLNGTHTGEKFGYSATGDPESFFNKRLDYYTVTYAMGDATGGTPPDPVIVKKGVFLVIPIDRPLKKTGYTQGGWATSENATKGTSSIKVEGTTTLYPVWEANTFRATFSGRHASTSSGFGLGAVTYGKEWTGKIKASSGYDLPETVTVTVDGTTLDSSKYTYTKSTGTITVPAEYVTGAIVVYGTGNLSEVISVDISWGTMAFTYSDGDWNADTHAYENGGWSPTDTNGDRVTVKNSGNVSVNIQLIYSVSDGAVSARFTDSAGTTLSQVTLAAGVEKKAWLKLSGKPSTTMMNKKLGTVTIKIGGKTT
ncbi:MAG TPA: hypothetical protein DDY70_00925 [Clostridiales bacterium]|nr:hypothetical protein [Clostridiales bacterium]